MNDDGTLLARYSRLRDEGAFAEVVRRHMGWTYAIALRRVGQDRQLAEDVVQAVFTALAREVRRFQGGRPVGPWLHRAVIFASANAVRGEVRRRRRAEQLMNELPPTSFQNPPASVEDTTAALDELLNHARDSERVVLTLRFFENQGIAEIAHRLCITEEAVRKRLERALERLRVSMEKRGIRSTAAAISALLAADGAAAAPAGLASAVSAGAIQGAGGLVVAGPLLHLMNAKATIAAIATAIGIGIGLALYEARQADLAESAAADEERSVAAVHEQSARSSSPNAVSPASDAGVSRAQPQASSSAEDAHATATLTGGNAQRASPESDDKYHEALSAALWASQALYFEPWFQKNNIDAVQAKKVLDTFLQWQRSGGNLADELAGVLGPQLSADFDRFRQNSQDRNYVKVLAGALYDTPSPLSVDQISQLTAALLNNDSNVVSGRPNGRPGEINWNAVDQQAARILNGPQLVAWQSVENTIKWARAMNGRP